MILNISKEDLEILNELVGYGYNSIADDLPMDKDENESSTEGIPAP